MAGFRLVLADDHPLIRQGLRKILEGRSDLEVVGEAGDGLELLSVLKQTLPDLVVLDISMPRLRGLEAIGEIRATYSETKILVLSMHKEYVFQALSAGAQGYLLKEDADQELFAAIEGVRQGKIFLSPRLACEIAGKGQLAEDPLSNRERQVLKLVAEGMSNKEIAEHLFISVRTAESHRASIMAKLNLKNTADLVKYALQKGYA